MFKSDDSKLPALYAALAKARAAFEALKPNKVAKITHKSGGQHSFPYADLGAINEATVKALSANGLVVSQFIGESENGILYLWTGLMHSEGAALVTKTALPGPEQFDDVKKFGSHVTYMRRYIKTGLLDLSGEEDLDSNGIPPGEGEKVGVAQPVGGESQQRNESLKVARRTQQQEPAQQNQQGDHTTAVISEGQVKYLLNKAAASQANIDAVLANLGIAPLKAGVTTVDEFNKIKTSLS